MKDNRLFELLGDIDDKHLIEAAPAAKLPHKRPGWVKWGAIAACVALIVSVGFGSVALITEAREYNAAVQFFNENDMPTEGLTREEVKAVHEDITSGTFTLPQTVTAIQNSFANSQNNAWVLGTDQPSPEDVEALWNYKTHDGSAYDGGWADTTPHGIHYKGHHEYVEMEFQGSYLEKYEGETLIWSTLVSKHRINNRWFMSDGSILVSGYIQERTAFDNGGIIIQTFRPWFAKLSADGRLLWHRELDNGFESSESISQIVENADGSYAVMIRGDRKQLLLCQYSTDGELLESRAIDFEGGLSLAIRYEDAYMILSGSQLVRLERDGTITTTFTYQGDGTCGYSFTDMIAYNGKIYLSLISFPTPSGRAPFGIQNSDLDAVLCYVYDNKSSSVPTEVLTPMIRANYTAMLLMVDPATGTPTVVQSVKGSLGSTLSVSATGALLWETESITNTFYHSFANSYMFGGVSFVYRYSFDGTGRLLSREKTGDIVDFRR